MFNTAIRDQDNHEKANRIVCQTDHKKFRVSSKKVSDKSNVFINHSTLRPSTTPVGQYNPEDSLNTTGKSSNLVDVRTIDVMENDLESEYKEQMGGYLRRKLRQMVGKRQEEVMMNRYLNNTIDVSELQNVSGNSAFNQLSPLYNQKNKVKVSKGVDEAYVRNTKQQIVRLIERKREQQGEYRSLNRSIKVKIQENDEKKMRTFKDHFKVPSVQKEGWDLQWRQSVSMEKSRYRDRLMMKCRRDNGGLWLVNFDK